MSADHDGAARSSSRGRSSASSARRSGASTRSTSSPAASGSRWTSTSRTRCRRWSAGRRRSTGRRARSRNLAAGQGDARGHRRGDHPAHARTWPAASPSAARRSGSASTRSARSTWVGPGHRRTGKSDASVLADLKKAELPLTPPVNLLAQDDRAAVHVPLPPRRPAGDELRGRRRPAGQRRDLVEPQDADLGPGADRPEPRAAARPA